jgi:hypothetical protein
VGADLVVLEGYASQPYVFANTFRVKQLFDEYGYERVLYVDGDILIAPGCVNFFELVPEDHVAILSEGTIYDYWMLAHYRHEALELLRSQGLEADEAAVPPPHNAGFYLMPRAYKDALTPPAQPFPLCYRNGATVEQTWFSLMLRRLKAPLHLLKFPEQHWLWYLDQKEQLADKAMVLHFCGLHDPGDKRYRRLLHHASRMEDGERTQAAPSSRPAPRVSAFDSQMTLDHAAPAGLKMRDVFTVSSHQYGWSVAVKALSVLSHPEGVLFDGFVERSFLWDLDKQRELGKIPYREPWIGFLHHPPGVPPFPSIAKHRIQHLTDEPAGVAAEPRVVPGPLLPDRLPGRVGEGAVRRRVRGAALPGPGAGDGVLLRQVRQ